MKSNSLWMKPHIYFQNGFWKVQDRGGSMVDWFAALKWADKRNAK